MKKKYKDRDYKIKWEEQSIYNMRKIKCLNKEC